MNFNLDNHSAAVTHLEPDVFECEVKWTLGSITTNKTSGGDGILARLFKIIKDDAFRVLHSVCQQIWKTQQWTGISQFSLQSHRRVISKNVQTITQLCSFQLLVR